MSGFLTLEGFDDALLGALTEEQAKTLFPPKIEEYRKPGEDPGKVFYDAIWEGINTFDSHGKDAWRWYRNHVEDVIPLHPEGGCIYLKDTGIRSDAYDGNYYLFAYHPSQGSFCFPPKRPDLFQPQAPAEQFTLFDAYNDPGLAGAPMDYTIDPVMLRRLQAEGIDMTDPVNLEFWGRLKKAFTPPRAVRKFVQRRIFKPVVKTAKYAGAATLPSVFMPAGMRKRVFGLSDKDSSRFETYAKVSRGVAAAVATVYAGPAALSLMKAAAVKAGVGAAKVGGWLKGMAVAKGAGAAAAKTAGAKAAETGFIAKIGGSIWGGVKAAGMIKAASILLPNQVPAAAQGMADGDVIEINTGGSDPAWGVGTPAPVAGLPYPETPTDEDFLFPDGFQEELKDAPADFPTPQASKGLNIVLVSAILGAILIAATRRRGGIPV